MTTARLLHTPASRDPGRPAEITPQWRRRRAHARRKAWDAAGRTTYYLRIYGDAPPTITCLCCEMTSAHPQDVAARYCGFCRKFHRREDGWPR